MGKQGEAERQKNGHVQCVINLMCNQYAFVLIEMKCILIGITIITFRLSSRTVGKSFNTISQLVFGPSLEIEGETFLKRPMSLVCLFFPAFFLTAEIVRVCLYVGALGMWRN